MNKNTKTTLIVALSLFGAGVLIWLCVSLGVGFDYSKLSGGFLRSTDGTITNETSTEPEHIEKDIDEKGQDIVFDLSSASVTVEPSADGKIHLTYDNTEDCYFEFKESDDSITLKQKQEGGYFFGFMFINDAPQTEVVLSLPAGREGLLSIDGVSGSILISGLDIKDSSKIYSVSGKISIENCKTDTLETGTTSGDVQLASVDTESLKATTVSGSISLSDISNSIPVTLASTSGEVYAENVKVKDFSVNTVSGGLTLRNVSGKKADLSSTSGSVTLDSADFSEIKFGTVSGDIRGTVAGSSEDYTVYTETLSGSNNLSDFRGSGTRTIDLSSTSGSFDIGFED